MQINSFLGCAMVPSFCCVPSRQAVNLGPLPTLLATTQMYESVATLPELDRPQQRQVVLLHAAARLQLRKHIAIETHRL